MAHFLCDQVITNVTITENTIKQISSLFENRLARFNANIAEDKRAILSYVIRFDGKGYHVYSLKDLLLYFQQAKEIERIIFTFETSESMLSNRRIGAIMELLLDQKNSSACFLNVTSDDKDWVDASFSAVQDILAKSKNKNGWVRMAWTDLVIQIVGVAFGFFISLWISNKISPKLLVQNSFIICFLFALLIFSNTWSYLNKRIHFLLNKYFPNIKFYRSDKDQINMIVQAVISAVLGTIVLGILGLLFSYAMNILSGFFVHS